MNAKRRLSQNLTASANKLRLDTINKILKIDSNKKTKKQLTKQVSRVALSELLKNSSSTADGSQIMPEIPDFRTFLSNKDNVQLFREFLKMQYCHENIDFYLACEKYRELDQDKVGPEFIKLMLTQIFNDFLSKDARRPVNVNYDCVQKVINSMKNPRPDLLCDAQNEIFQLMATDCYPRFCKTWQMDRDIAQKILCERSIGPDTNTSYLTNKTLGSIYEDETTNSSSVCTSNISSSSQTRSICSKSTSSKSRLSSDCPDECPYYRVALPCQHHKRIQVPKIAKKVRLNLPEPTDLNLMHKIPDCATHRTPPPPPLPPKPKKIRPDSSKKEQFPFVSQVFDV